MLLVMNTVVRIARAAVLMQGKAHDLPASGTSSGDKHGKKGGEEFAIALAEGYGRTENESMRPVDPWTCMHIRWSCL